MVFITKQPTQQLELLVQQLKLLLLKPVHTRRLPARVPNHNRRAFHMRSAPTIPDNRIKLILINGLIVRDEVAYISRKAPQYAAICSGYVPKLARDDLGSLELFQSPSVIQIPSLPSCTSRDLHANCAMTS